MPKHKQNNSESPNLSAQVALITGGAKRIGATLAKSLHAQGMTVIIQYRSSRDAARLLANSLNAIRPDSCYLRHCELGDYEQLRPLIDESAVIRGRLDLLINNASAFFPTPLGEIDEAHWSSLIDCNLKAPFFLSQAAAPYLTQHGGNIINLIDIYAERPLPGHAIYCASKAGLASLTRSLAQSLAPGVRVNGIAPGAILWPENPESDSDQRGVISRTPLARIGDPQDIASTALFLIRDAHYMTGQILAVDGGRSIVP